ncbi:(Trans)glycosidase [Apiospora kogelbergensis]|uniref:(Trans)glycosidase n=1 Tax=Apiospora kogelbergensis TaxID=1337665 RepID=UPI0031316603
MWPLQILAAAAAAAAVAAASRPAAVLSPVTRTGSTLLVDGKPWKAVGPNVYWLGLDENVVPPEGEPYDPVTKSSYPAKGRITDVLATVRALGGTMIRSHTLGISLGNPLSVMPVPGVVNDAAFASIDWAVYQAGQYGIRLMIPLIDNFIGLLPWGKYTFLRWAGFNLTQGADATNPEIQQFYTNATIVAAFNDYIAKILTHQNPYTNQTYAEDPTIFAYETGNELLGPVWGDMDCPADWVADIARVVKRLAPQKLFVDGTYGVNKTHLAIDEVDVFSNHYYPVDTAKLQADLDLVEGAGKAWVGPDANGTKNMTAFFDIMEKSTVAVGDAFWSLFGRNLPDCGSFVDHSDGFTLQYGNPANSEYTNHRIQLIRKHFLAMGQGTQIAPDDDLPVVPCPAPAL